jgi:His-Xaa-Ser system protein HxsD
MDSLPESIRIGASSPCGVQLEFDLAVYRLSAIKKAAYRFGDRFHVQLAGGQHDRVQVVLIPKTDADDAEFWAGEFCNEVLDQDLREVVAEETSAIRNLLLAQAFSATSLLDELGDRGDYLTDPMAIRTRRAAE